jgi:predicted metal-dependent peptidase
MANSFSMSECTAKLMNKEPFLGCLLMNLPKIEDEKIGTLGVDGEYLYYNQSFWDKHTNKEKYALLMHEAGHLFLHHIWRGRNYKDIAIDPTSGQVISVFNLAGDYVINLMIDMNKQFQLPKGCLLDHKYDNWATEEVYADLQKKLPQASQKDLEKFLSSSMCNKSMWDKKQGKEAREAEKRWQNRIKQAAEFAKSKYKGNEPAWLKRLYEDMQPQEDWRVLLREYIEPYQGDFSFNPVDRRFLESDFMLPEIQDGEQVDWLAIAIDTSGSIGDKELTTFLAELRGVLGSYDRVKVRLTFCDTEATPFVELNEFEKDKIQPTGGGGTSFVEPFELCKKEDTPPKALIYFTDLCGDFPSRAPQYDVLWIATEKGNVPFGKVLPFRI